MPHDVVLAEENAVLKQRIKHLEEYIQSLRHAQFGSSSEQYNPDQQELFNEAEDELDKTIDEPEQTIAAHTRNKKKRVSIPDEIPREEVIHDLADDDKFCPKDGTALKRIGEETSEQLDVIPAKIKALRHIRIKYACPCCEQYLVTAPKPKQPIEKSIASPGLLAHIVASKYIDGLPLYRQCAIFTRMGIEIDRSSMANWTIKCGALVQPLINLLQERMLEQAVLHMDETPVQVLDEPGKTAQSKSYMWVTVSQSSPAVLFNYSASRGQETPKALLENYEGALMVDGYEGYSPVCVENQLTRLGCWAHARRKFMSAKQQQAKGKIGKADVALSHIQTLYRIEREIKDKNMDERRAIRQSQAKPEIDKLKKWLDKTLLNTPPKSTLGKALVYLSNQWSRVIPYLDHGAYPIDNNPAENAIRPFVIGRKNWLFSQSQAGVRASANLYSLVETAKVNGLEPYAYLRQIFTLLPQAETVEDVEKLLPWNVKSVVG